MLLPCKASHVEPGSMKRAVPEESSESKRNFFKQDSFSFGYDASPYANYSSPSSSAPSTIAQPLPGQPPLPPMPPPPSGVPPPPHVFGPVPSQVAPIQWTHAHTPWQWIAPQTSPLPHPTPHDIANTIHREIPLRGNYVRRERFHSRSNMYNVQRNNFRKNRRVVRFGQPQSQFDQAAYFGATLAGNLGLEWRRSNYPATTNDAIISHMTVPLPNHPISSIPPGIVSNRHTEETEDQDVKIEKVVKKNKQRKPMSQSYVNKPWNREDAERALKIESEYNMKNKVNAQSLIIKFPDTDLNKDIVGQFHPEILTIHFQNPCGPRFCFIQMAEDVNIDEAMKELEKIKFGVGHLKVEKKSLRDEDNPEEIDPYTLFIGNLPESVKTSEIKSKFPKAQDEETRMMKNTGNVFMRYNSVDDAISDYKQAYGLMLDKRSINVRFRRKRGNTCLPEEPKLDVKKVKEEPSNAAQVEKERNHVGLELNVNELKEEESKTDEKTKEDKMSQSYPSKPWNREDAERALMTENEYNMKNKVNAQRLIIKFPDPDLNKDIIRLFHHGIRNIHFQNPSGPRYCFVQMAKSVNIDQAIKELEKVKFGTGYLKVEKKAVRNEDIRNTKPEDINPYNLYIGNLPTFVKANEIKSKFPKARVDVSRARKLKNTQFAFMRYNSVDDAIADYKKAYGLMWDTRSIIVKFRRKEGNAYLPEELKPDVKKVKEELSNAAQVEKELNANHIELKPNVNESKKEDSTGQTKENKVNHADKSSMSQDMDSVEVRLQDNSSKAQNKSALQIQENTNSHSSLSPTSITSDKTMQEQQRQPWNQEKDSDEENNAEILQNENTETNEVDVIDIGQTSTDIKQEVKVFASLEESSKVKKKKRQTQIDERIDEAYSYLAAKRRKEETSEKKQKDECDIFGELIVAKLRKFDDYTRQLIMKDINTTMFRASIQPTQNFQRDNFTQPNTFVQSFVSPLCSYSVQSSPIVSSQPSPNISYTPQPSPNTSYTPQPSPNTSHTPQPSTSASHTIT